MDIRAWLDDTVYQQPPESVCENEGYAQKAKIHQNGNKQQSPDQLQHLLSSYIYPDQRQQAWPSNGSDHSACPEKGRYGTRQAYLDVPSSSDIRHDEYVLRQHETPDPYKRKPRRKTRPDHYEIKHKKSQTVKPRKRKHRQTSRDEISATDRLRNSLALKARPSKHRLTLRATDSFGLFRHGKVSGGLSGVPDLTFNDMTFLRNSRGRDATEQVDIPEAIPIRQHSDDRQISTYFNAAREDEDDQHVHHAAEAATAVPSSSREDQPALLGAYANTDHGSHYDQPTDRRLTCNIQYASSRSVQRPSRVKQIEDVAALETTPARHYRATMTTQAGSQDLPSAIHPQSLSPAPVRDTDADLLNLIIGSKRTQPHDHTRSEQHTSDILNVFMRPELTSINDTSYHRLTSTPPACTEQKREHTAAISNRFGSGTRRSSHAPYSSRRQFDEHDVVHLSSPSVMLPVRGLQRFDRSMMQQQAQHIPEPFIAVSKHHLWRPPILQNSVHVACSWGPFSRDRSRTPLPVVDQAVGFSQDRRIRDDSSSWTSGAYDTPAQYTRAECSFDWPRGEDKEHASQDCGNEPLPDTTFCLPEQAEILSFEPKQGFWRPNCLY